MPRAGALKVETGEPVKVTEPARFRLELDLIPPSVNATYAKASNGWYRPPALKDFKRNFTAACLYAITRKLPAKTPFALTIWINVNRKRDLDNCAKALLDGLKDNGLTPDDRYCDRLTLIRDCTIKGCVIEAEAL